MAKIDREMYNKLVPSDLQCRIQGIHANKNGLVVDDWLTGITYVSEEEYYIDSDIMACCCHHECGKNGLSTIYFGFIKAHRLVFNDKPATMPEDASKFLFCAVHVITRISGLYKGYWGRNDFRDEDFEIVARFFLGNSKRNTALPKVINKFELTEYNLRNIIHLCNDRINNEIIKRP